MLSAQGPSRILAGATLVGYDTTEIGNDKIVTYSGGTTFNEYVRDRNGEWSNFDVFTAGFEEGGLSKKDAAEHMRDRGYTPVI